MMADFKWMQNVFMPLLVAGFIGLGTCTASTQERLTKSEMINDAQTKTMDKMEDKQDKLIDSNVRMEVKQETIKEDIGEIKAMLAQMIAREK